LILDKTPHPHDESTYTLVLVVDYGQNMPVPVFNQQQPGRDVTITRVPVNLCTYSDVSAGERDADLINPHQALQLCGTKCCRQ
jgi:hypothetical protein